MFSIIRIRTFIIFLTLYFIHAQSNQFIETNSNAPWGIRRYHTSVMHDDKIYVMGGYNGTYVFGDIWSSADSGATWAEVDIVSGYGSASGHSSFVHNGVIYIIAAYKVWSSADDGVTWVEASADIGWGGLRRFQGSVVCGDVIYVLGGLVSNIAVNDIWSSADWGVTWAEVLPTSGSYWEPRSDLGAVVYDSNIYVMGGWKNYTTFNDVWSSSDGCLTWVEVTAAAGWGVRHKFTSLVYKTKIYIMGGSNHTYAGYSDLWSSDDGGVTWSEEMNPTGWSGRFGHSSVIQNDQIFVIGGTGGNDVWYYKLIDSIVGTGTHEKRVAVGVWVSVNVALVGWVLVGFMK